MMAGKSINDTTKEVATPMLIIYPRFTTGFKSANTREPKPAIVVIIAKKDGFALDVIVRKTNSF